MTTQFVESRTSCVTLVLLFALALALNCFFGGSLPACTPGFINVLFTADVSQHETAELIAHGPTFPPDPWENKIAHGPTFPPDPWENKVAHGPTFPPDPWEQA